MIPLLAELARAGREEAWPADEEGERALRLLEWPRVAAGIAGLCLSRRAAAAVTARRPYVAAGPIALRRRLADELRAPGERGEWPPLLEISDVMDWLEGPRPLALEGSDLLQVAAAAVALDALADHFRRDPDAWPTWSGAAARQERLGHLAAAVRRTCDRDGRLRDDATPVLGRLRRAARDQERAARAAAERALAQARAAGLVTGDEVTLRGDRYCLPLRAGARRRLEGIVHDRSATGGTLFVEPAAVVELHNALVETRLEMASEEARILAELNRAVEAAAPVFSDAGGLLTLADETRAALQWGARRRGSRPALDAGGSLRLCAARHPLLDPSAGGALAGGVVPLDLELPAGRRVLLVSGPNAGGKSVALKTVGVCVLLAQSGWDVPAREDSRLPLVRRLFVDLGDEQSIEHSLSSFSAHLGHLARFVDGAGDGALVLCDEICSGTDPDEGAALALAVLETPRGARRDRARHDPFRPAQGRGARSPRHAQRRDGFRRPHAAAALHAAHGGARGEPCLRHRRPLRTAGGAARGGASAGGRGAFPGRAAARGAGGADPRAGGARGGRARGGGGGGRAGAGPGGAARRAGAGAGGTARRPPGATGSGC